MPSNSYLGYTGVYGSPAMPGIPLGQGYRWHLPALGRFNAMDELSPFDAGGINPYAYCDGDPINQWDPTGHMSEAAKIALGAGIGVLAVLAAIGAMFGGYKGYRHLIKARSVEDAWSTESALSGEDRVISGTRTQRGGGEVQGPWHDRNLRRVQFSEVRTEAYAGGTKRSRRGVQAVRGSSLRRGQVRVPEEDSLPEEVGPVDYLQMAEGKVNDTEGALGVLHNLAAHPPSQDAGLLSAETRLASRLGYIQDYNKYVARRHWDLAVTYRNWADQLMPSEDPMRLRLQGIDVHIASLNGRLKAFPH